MKNHYTTQEIADITGVSLATVNNWINAGALESFKTPGGHNRIRSENLKKFLKENNIPPPPGLEDSSSARVLVVEDDEDVRDFVTAVLDELDFPVEAEVAPDGFTAGSKVLSFKPDLVILDIMLPGINGFEVCRSIRKEHGDTIKILAMTGYYKEENRARIMEAGADAFIKKPMVLQELREKIEKLLLKGKSRFFIGRKEADKSQSL